MNIKKAIIGGAAVIACAIGVWYGKAAFFPDAGASSELQDISALAEQDKKIFERLAGIKLSIGIFENPKFKALKAPAVPSDKLTVGTTEIFIEEEK